MSDKLKRLAQSALAIPGMIAGVHAAGPAEAVGSYRYSIYTEDDSPAARDDSGGSQERYTINVHQLHWMSPILDKYSVSVESSFETMSGASPAFTYIPEGEEEVVTYFSGASEETRIDTSVSGRMYGSTYDVGANAYVSAERDYFALSSGVDGSLQINDQMTTISGGVSAGYDFLSPTTLLEPGSDEQAISEPARYAAEGENKWQISAFEGVGQIIDMNTVVRSSISLTYKGGYLSDAYRDCPATVSQVVPCDIRPSSRVIGTLDVGGRRYIPQLNAVVHADYRLYLDSWDIASHTLDLDYYQNWAPQWGFFTRNNVNLQVVPGIRYYQQSAAYFYEVPDANDAIGGVIYDANTTEYYSSDPRISQYGAIALKMRLNIDFRNFMLATNIERYTSNPALGFNDEDTPGLASFWRFGVGLDFTY